MGSDQKSLRNIFVWAHGRGTLQYDIICALILAFIFFVPRSCFLPEKKSDPSIQKPHTVSQPATTNDEKTKK